MMGYAYRTFAYPDYSELSTSAPVFAIACIMNKRQQKKARRWYRRPQKPKMRDRQYPRLLVETQTQWMQLLYGNPDPKQIEEAAVKLKPMPAWVHRISAGYGYWTLEETETGLVPLSRYVMYP